MGRSTTEQKGSGATATGLTVYAAKKLHEQFVKSQKGFKGEKHALLNTDQGNRLANYLGPGTAVLARLSRKDGGISHVDSVAKRHDIDYSLAAAAASDKEQRKLIREADRRMVEAIKIIKRDGTDSARNIAIGLRLIQAKMRLEDLVGATGKWFSGKRVTYTPDELKTLRTALARLKQKGGKLFSAVKHLRKLTRHKGGAWAIPSVRKLYETAKKILATIKARLRRKPRNVAPGMDIDPEYIANRRKPISHRAVAPSKIELDFGGEGKDWVDKVDVEMEKDGTVGSFTKQARAAGYEDTMRFARAVMAAWRSGKKKVKNLRKNKLMGISKRTMYRANFAVNAQKGGEGPWITKARHGIEGTEGSFTREARDAGYEDTMEFAGKIMKGWRSCTTKQVEKEECTREVRNKKTKEDEDISMHTMRRANFALNAQQRDKKGKGMRPLARRRHKELSGSGTISSKKATVVPDAVAAAEIARREAISAENRRQFELQVANLTPSSEERMQALREAAIIANWARERETRAARNAETLARWAREEAKEEKSGSGKPWSRDADTERRSAVNRARKKQRRACFRGGAWISGRELGESYRLKLRGGNTLNMQGGAQAKGRYPLGSDSFGPVGLTTYVNDPSRGHYEMDWAQKGGCDSCGGTCGKVQKGGAPEDEHPRANLINDWWGVEEEHPNANDPVMADAQQAAANAHAIVTAANAQLARIQHWLDNVAPDDFHGEHHHETHEPEDYKPVPRRGAGQKGSGMLDEIGGVEGSGMLDEIGGVEGSGSLNMTGGAQAKGRYPLGSDSFGVEGLTDYVNDPHRGHYEIDWAQKGGGDAWDKLKYALQKGSGLSLAGSDWKKYQQDWSGRFGGKGWKKYQQDWSGRLGGKGKKKCRGRLSTCGHFS